MEADENRGAERMRLLKMLEEGKINAEECGELLDALDEPAAPPPKPPARPRIERRFAVCGLALVFIGFFMTWFIVDLNLAMAKAISSVTGGAKTLPSNVRINLNPKPKDGGVIVRISGGDVQHGLGWVVLACAIGAAFIPRWKVGVCLMLLAGAILIRNFCGVLDVGTPGAGFWLVSIGALVEAVSLLAERVSEQGA